jgi:hypothetical protein
MRHEALRLASLWAARPSDIRRTTAHHRKTGAGRRKIQAPISRNAGTRLDHWRRLGDQESDKSSQVTTAKKSGDPLLDVSERPIPRVIPPCPKCRPFSTPIRRSWKPLLQGSDDGVLCPVELSIAAQNPEPAPPPSVAGWRPAAPPGGSDQSGGDRPVGGVPLLMPAPRASAGSSANQARRMRLPQHDQLPASYPELHCSHRRQRSAA